MLPFLCGTNIIIFVSVSHYTSRVANTVMQRPLRPRNATLQPSAGGDAGDKPQQEVMWIRRDVGDNLTSCSQEGGKKGKTALQLLFLSQHQLIHRCVCGV